MAPDPFDDYIFIEPAARIDGRTERGLYVLARREGWPMRRTPPDGAVGRPLIVISRASFERHLKRPLTEAERRAVTASPRKVPVNDVDPWAPLDGSSRPKIPPAGPADPFEALLSTLNHDQLVLFHAFMKVIHKATAAQRERAVMAAIQAVETFGLPFETERTVVYRPTNLPANVRDGLAKAVLDDLKPKEK